MFVDRNKIAEIIRGNEMFPSYLQGIFYLNKSFNLYKFKRHILGMYVFTSVQTLFHIKKVLGLTL